MIGWRQNLFDQSKKSIQFTCKPGGVDIISSVVFGARTQVNPGEVEGNMNRTQVNPGGKIRRQNEQDSGKPLGENWKVT